MLWGKPNPWLYFLLGFNREILHRACCGYGGKYNFNPVVLCGKAGDVPDPNGGPSKFVNLTESCRRPEEYVVWDGMHSTEAFYRVMARFFLTGRFVDGTDNDCLNLQELCNLDFSEWGWLYLIILVAPLDYISLGLAWLLIFLID